MKQKMILTVCSDQSGLVVTQTVSSPQRLRLPARRETHGMSINNRIHSKQLLEVCYKCILRIYGIQPIYNATQLGVYFIRKNLPVGYPVVNHLSGQNGYGRKSPVPNSGVMSKAVPQGCYAQQPTAKNQMLFEAKVMCNTVLNASVTEIAEKLGQRTQRSNFESFPGRWKFLLPVFPVVAGYEFLLRPLQFSIKRFQMAGEERVVCKQVSIYKPERVVAKRKMMDNLCADGNFYSLDGGKKQCSQLFIEVVILNGIAEVAVRKELMSCGVCLQGAPVICQTEIANKIQRSFCICFVVNDKSALFQKGYLLSDSNRALAVVHKTYRNAKSHPVALLLRGRVVGTVGAKVRTFPETPKCLAGNLSN